MKRSIDECDFNIGYFHFTNINNLESILNSGLEPRVGTASQMINDRPNVSISQGFRGILGIVNSFIFVLSETRLCDVPVEFRKYFSEDIDFNDENMVGNDLACTAIRNKLKEEVYLYINTDNIDLESARIGGLTGFDINLENGIPKENISVITDADGNIISAYDIVSYIYDRLKDNDIVREMNTSLFSMMEMEQVNNKTI